MQLHVNSSGTAMQLHGNSRAAMRDSKLPCPMTPHTLEVV